MILWEDQYKANLSSHNTYNNFDNINNTHNGYNFCFLNI